MSANDLKSFSLDQTRTTGLSLMEKIFVELSVHGAGFEPALL
jgi:hypothetical protein